MTPLDDRIRDAVAGFLKRSGLSGRRFGIDALNDPGFVASLKGGRRLTLATADTVLAAMGEAPLRPGFVREVEAFLERTGTKPYVLGERAAGDPSFVERLHGGVSFRLVTVDKVRAWMAAQADAACLAAMARAVAGVRLLARGGNEERQGETDMNHEESPHLSAREAAAWLGVSARTLHRMREEGGGPDHYRFGHRILYRLDHLKRWAAERHVPGGPDGPGRRAA